MNKKSVKRQEKTKKYYKEPLSTEAQEKIEQQLYAIGQRLCHQRKLVNMTQDVAGKALGVSKQMISLHENGKKISIDYLEKYSRLYDCSVELFFTDEPVTPQMLHTIDQAAAMSRVIPKIKSWYQRDSFKTFQFLDIDFREVQRWKVFAEKNFSYTQKNNTTHDIQSVPLLQFVRIALELEVPIAEIFFGK